VILTHSNFVPVAKRCDYKPIFGDIFLCGIWKSSQQISDFIYHAFRQFSLMASLSRPVINIPHLELPPLLSQRVLDDLMPKLAVIFRVKGEINCQQWHRLLGLCHLEKGKNPNKYD
jgi:hypothetical protein